MEMEQGSPTFYFWNLPDTIHVVHVEETIFVIYCHSDAKWQP